MTVIETAKENGLDVFSYLKFLLEKLAAAAGLRNGQTILGLFAMER
ncbi:transposase domain-containing protein [Lacticaseibacillus rhamnosus]|nr:transposase domain-containing protein [Lacticaseibacillus rhamnosus]MDK7183714.1 transposase domain-containing protein [Lacticaseibacillus rhamnosus]MDK7240514.1 transposase domain-containing protein [Lacticaseibacillus rhamnosus]MDT8863200.1 transposase domain-containing protein [Lacticaseibacillus rhamnosus]